MQNGVYPQQASDDSMAESEEDSLEVFGDLNDSTTAPERYFALYFSLVSRCCFVFVEIYHLGRIFGV
jgi:hypothetical protein